jgi:phage shock protein C
MNSRLVRSRSNRMIAGVCAGLAAYLGVDPLWIRLCFVLLTILTNGAGILVYIVLVILMPEEEATASAPSPSMPAAEDMAQRMAEAGERLGRSLSGQMTSPQGAVIFGLILILLGLAFLARNLGLLWWLRGDLVWPLALIALGLALLIREIRR